MIFFMFEIIVVVVEKSLKCLYSFKKKRLTKPNLITDVLLTKVPYALKFYASWSMHQKRFLRDGIFPSKQSVCFMNLQII